MERCPVEVWREITVMACTDGGYTGCSLSLVSRTMRDIVRNIRYASVALTAQHQYPAFVASLRNASGPVAIHHLFLSIALGTDEKVPQDCTDAILQAAAPSLRTLVVHGLDFFWMPDIVFPMLTDLSMPYIDLPAAGKLPRLHRYHPYKQSFFDYLGYWLADSVPTLTHLRLSDISQAIKVIPFLRVLLHGPSSPPAPIPEGVVRPTYFLSYAQTHHWPGSDQEQHALDLAAKLPDLVHIFMQQTAVPSAYASDEDPGHRGAFQRSMEVRTTLRALAEASGGGHDTGRRLHVLPDAPADDPYSFAQAHECWLDLVKGGDGLWQVPNI